VPRYFTVKHLFAKKIIPRTSVGWTPCKAIGDRLHCCFVDNGLLRHKEQERVMKMFKDHLHLPVTCIDDSVRLLGKLAGVTDPEKKRKCIGAQFIEVFKEYKAEVEALNPKP